VKKLVDQFWNPSGGYINFDYNSHGARSHKFGSPWMGLEAHAYAVDMKWLGVHRDDILGQGIRVADSSLQQWSTSDERVYAGVDKQMEVLRD